MHKGTLKGRYVLEDGKYHVIHLLQVKKKNTRESKAWMLATTFLFGGRGRYG